MTAWSGDVRKKLRCFWRQQQRQEFFFASALLGNGSDVEQEKVSTSMHTSSGPFFRGVG